MQKHGISRLAVVPGDKVLAVAEECVQADVQTGLGLLDREMGVLLGVSGRKTTTNEVRCGTYRRIERVHALVLVHTVVRAGHTDLAEMRLKQVH